MPNPVNTNGTLGAAIIAQEGLALLKATYPILTSIATDFSDEPALYNQNIVTRIPSIGAVQSYDPVNGYVPASGSFNDVSVNLNNFKHASFAINDAEFSSTNRDLIKDYAQEFASSLGLDLMSSIAALFTSGNYSQAPTVQALTGVNRSTIIAADTALNIRNVSKIGRYAILNSSMYGQLKNDPNLVSLFFGALGISPDTLPNIDGVKVSEYSALPSTGNLQGVIAAKDSLVMVARTPSQAGQVGVPLIGNIQIVTDPDTGLSVMVREHYNFQLGSRQVTYTWIYGVGVGNPLSLQRITTA